MRRRDFVSLVIGGAVAWPFAAQEPGRTYRIGFLLPTNRQSPPVQALFDELRLNGFIEVRI
jgi:DNA-binding helix-hairpin-helix protein with protein kinase domain